MVARELLRELAETLLPQRCIVCRRFGAALHRDCLVALPRRRGGALRPLLGARPALPVRGCSAARRRSPRCARRTASRVTCGGRCSRRSSAA